MIDADCVAAFVEGFEPERVRVAFLSPIRHVQARLVVPIGVQGCLTLFGDNPARHRLFADHLRAEYRVQTSGRGRTVDEWKMRPEQSDNHWLDGLVGCAVGASIQGTSLLGEKASGGRALRTFVLPGNARAR